MPGDGVDRGKDNLEFAAKTAENVPFFGKLLALAIQQKRWTGLAVFGLLLWTLLIYPLLLPILSAWIINTGILRGSQESYAREVRKAFNADEFASEMASKSNKLLDYFQVIEFVGPANETRDYTLSASTNQKIKIRAERATLFSEDSESCALPAELLKVGPAGAGRVGPKIFSIRIGQQEVGAIYINPKGEPITLSSAQWDAIARESDPGRIEVTLEPVPALANLTCTKAKADVRVTFEVFKDLIPLASNGPGGR